MQMSVLEEVSSSLLPPNILLNIYDSQPEGVGLRSAATHPAKWGYTMIINDRFMVLLKVEY